MKKVIKFVKGKKDNEKEVIYEDPKKLIQFEKDYLDDSVSEISYDNQSEINDNNIKMQAEIDENEAILSDKSITSVHRAVWTENVDSLLTLIKTNDIDLTDKLDRTALYFAVMKNNPNLIEVLLDNNANQDISDIDGVTPFLKAVQMGSIESVLMLLKHNADFKRVDKDSNSCLHYAITGGHVDILSILLNQNIDCNIHNVNGEFPLHLAASCGEQRMCELLLGRGAIINPVDGRGATSLMCAAGSGHDNIVTLLLASNADPGIKDSQGRKAADYATASGYKDIATKLKNTSAKSSYSKASLPKVPDNRDNEDSDTWNDSPVSTPSIKQKKIEKNKKISEKFMREHQNNEDTDLSANEDHSESDSSRTNVRKSENASPQSNVIPPPCKPLRSIEYLQSRQEDGASSSTSSRTVHLMTLGPVRSRHISMTDQDKKKFDTLPHRYSYQGDLQQASCSDNRNASSGSKPAAPDLVAYCSLGEDPKLEKPPPRMPTPRNCECEHSDWGSESDSIPIEEYSNNKKDTKMTPNSDCTDHSSYIQKQFSLLENYERNHSRTCSVSHEKRPHRRRNEDLDDIANFLDDNNHINIKLEKYVVVEKSDIAVCSKKSRSLPRNYETNNGYYNGSNSLPRTTDQGKDFIRDMKRYGSYRPKSNFQKSKSDGGSKKHGLIDKLRNIFHGKKSQIHLIENQDPNSTWMYKEKNTCSSKNCHNKDRGCAHSSNYDELSLSSESVKGYDNRKGIPLASMSYELGHSAGHSQGHSRKSSSSRSYSEKTVYEKYDDDAKSGKSTPKYEEEVKRLVCEKSSRKECRCNSAMDVDVTDKWQKHHEVEMMSNMDPLERENKRLEDMISHLQSELSSSNRRLCEMECMLSRAQNDVDEIVANETIKLKQILENENKNMIHKLKDENNKLKRELQSIRCGYDKLHNIYSETERAFSESVDEHGSIIDENEYLKDENKKLALRIGQVISQINLVKEVAEKKNKTLRIQLKKSNMSHVKAGDGPHRKSSLDYTNDNMNMPKNLIGDAPKEPLNLNDESRLISITDLVVQIQNLNSENTDMYFKLQQSELQKSVALMENENDRLKEKLLEQEKYSNELQKTIDELKEENLDGCNKIEEIIEDNDKLRKGMEEMLSKMEFLKDDIISKNQIIKEQDTKIGKFLSDSQRTEQVIRELESKLRNLQSDYNEKCCESLASDTQKMEINKKLIDLEDKFGEMEKENEELKEKVEKLQNEKQENAKQLQNAKENVTQLQNNFVICKTSIDKLQESNKLLQESAKEVTDKYMKLESTYDDNIEGFQKKIELLYSENNCLRGTIQESQQKCGSLENKIALISLQHSNELLTKNIQCASLERADCKLCQELEEIKASFQKEKELLQKTIEQKEQLNLKLVEEAQQIKLKTQELNLVNRENIEMKNAVEVLKTILSDNIFDSNEFPRLSSIKLEKIASEIYEKLGRSSLKRSPTKLVSKIPKKVSVLATLPKIGDQNHLTLKSSQSSQGENNLTKNTSNSMPDLEKINASSYEIIYEPNSTISLRKTSSLDSLQKVEVLGVGSEMFDLQWNKQFDAIQKFRFDLQRVTDRLLDFKNKNPSCFSLENKSKDVYYQELINNLQSQVSNLQDKATKECCLNFDLESELRSMKGNIEIMGVMEREISDLRGELEKERMKRMQEIEIIKIKKEDELKDLKNQLKEEFITRKQKLMTDLTIAQNALHVKNIEELKLKKKCDQLSKEVTLNQEARKRRLGESYQSTSKTGNQGTFYVQSLPISNVSLPYSVACIAVPAEVSSSIMKPSQSLKDVYSAELDSTVTRHRIKSDPAPVVRSLNDDDLENKYLLK